MRNTMMAATALVAMMAGPALAQTSAPATTPPATTTPPAATAPTAPATPSTPSTAATAPGGSFLDAQQSDQWLASKLIGTTVRGGGDESLGEVSDVVLAPDGRAVAVVIGVGGFLGVGEKSVAVPFSAVEKVRASDGDRLVVRHTKDELKAAPTFAPYQPPRPASTGTGTATSGSAPATPTR